MAGAAVAVLRQLPDRGRKRLPWRGRVQHSQQRRRPLADAVGQRRVHEAHLLVLPNLAGPHGHDRLLKRPFGRIISFDHEPRAAARLLRGPISLYTYTSNHIMPTSVARPWLTRQPLTQVTHPPVL